MNLQGKILSLGLGIMLAYACNNAKTKAGAKDFYVVTTRGASLDRDWDTLKVKAFYHHSKKDSLYSKYHFVLDGFEHELRKYSNVHNAAVDGAHVSYELDNMGVVYSMGFTFQNQNRLVCTDDSVNRLITYALGEALFNTEYDYSILVERNTPRRVVYLK